MKLLNQSGHHRLKGWVQANAQVFFWISERNFGMASLNFQLSGRWCNRFKKTSCWLFMIGNKCQHLHQQSYQLAKYKLKYKHALTLQYFQDVKTGDSVSSHYIHKLMKRVVARRWQAFGHSVGGGKTFFHDKSSDLKWTKSSKHWFDLFTGLVICHWKKNVSHK